jgi:hypothetical protein
MGKIIKKQSSNTKSTVESSFRKPGAEAWEPLQMCTSTKGMNDEAINKMCNMIEQANEILKSTLLQSLQMQNLVVLAGSGCSYHVGGSTMSDLWNVIVEENQKQANLVAQKIKYDITKKNIEAFLSQAEAASFLQDKEISDFSNKAKDIILKKMSSFISLNDRNKLKSHETFLHRLSRRRTRDRRLRVFTTNYDLCFEYATANIGCVAIDGFSFMKPRQYDPSYFDYDIIRRPRLGDDNGNYLEGVFLLYKLHGSINWERTDSSIIEKENPDPQKACIIYPASGKYQQSYNQPFIESISQYLMAIREPNTCLLVIGFGFNDDHLSEPLLSAVRSNPHLRLIVVDPNAKENANKNENHHLKDLFELSLHGEDVWFINESFIKFADRIPDLQSLTPAERLIKDIKGVI